MSRISLRQVAILSLALTTPVLGLPQSLPNVGLMPITHVTRAQSDIETSLRNIVDGITSFGATMDAFDGELSPIVESADTLLQSISTQVSALESTPAPQDTSTLLRETIPRMVSSVQSLAQNMVDNREFFQQVGMCVFWRQTLEGVRQGSAELLAAVAGSLSQRQARDVADLAQQLDAELSKAAQEYSVDNCQDNTGGDTPQPSSSAPPQPSSAPPTSPTTSSTGPDPITSSVPVVTGTTALRTVTPAPGATPSPVFEDIGAQGLNMGAEGAKGASLETGIAISVPGGESRASRARLSEVVLVMVVGGVVWAIA